MEGDDKIVNDQIHPELETAKYLYQLSISGACKCVLKTVIW